MKTIYTIFAFIFLLPLSVFATELQDFDSRKKESTATEEVWPPAHEEGSSIEGATPEVISSNASDDAGEFTAAEEKKELTAEEAEKAILNKMLLKKAEEDWKTYKKTGKPTGGYW